MSTPQKSSYLQAIESEPKEQANDVINNDVVGSKDNSANDVINTDVDESKKEGYTRSERTSPPSYERRTGQPDRQPAQRPSVDVIALNKRVEFLEGKMNLLLNVFADLGRFINAPAPPPNRPAPVRTRVQNNPERPSTHRQGPRQKRKERLAANRA